MTEMEWRHLALVRAAAAERQILQQHQLHPPSVVPSAFYQPSVVPAAGQLHPTGQVPFSVLPDGRRSAIPPAQSTSIVPAYRSVAPASSEFSSHAGLGSRENPDPVEVGGRVSLPDLKTRLPLTGSRSTTTAKRRGGNSFSIDSLLGRQQGGERSCSETLEVRKSVAEQVHSADAGWGGARHVSTLHRPTPVSVASAPVQHVVPGCTSRQPELVTLY